MCEKRCSLPFNPSALRAEVTALARQKRQGFLLLYFHRRQLAPKRAKQRLDYRDGDAGRT